MLCKHPYRIGVMNYGCGQCVPCRVNRSRLWVGRMLLESMEHPCSCFITLTYEENNLPTNEEVSKRDVQLFLKKLRKALAPRTVRYYMVSEYGEVNGRPHYHGILFGVSPVETEAVQSAWNKGHVMVGTAEHKSMSYVAGYIIKQGTQEGKLTRSDRAKEFSLMSRKPGLGSGVVERIKNAYQTPAGKAALAAGNYIGTIFRSGGFKYPIGRYLTGKCLDVVIMSDAQRSAYREAVIATRIEENRGKTRHQIRVERQARIDQEGFKTKPRRRTLQ